jgi:hypothetical protein
LRIAVVVEDVQTIPRPRKGGTWIQSFQIGWNEAEIR